jgi:hypothetical protein
VPQGRRLLSRAGRLAGGWWAALLFGAVILAFLWPALVGGDLFSPVSKLYSSMPWAPTSPPDYGSFYGGVLSDAAVDFYPWARYARDLIHDSTFPGWNPYVLSGTPFFANAQTALLSPFTLIGLLVPFNYSFGLIGALKLFVAAFGTYLLARELRASFWPAALAGLAFAFCAFQTVWLSHPQTNVSVWLPWMLWLTERVARRGTGRDAIGLALVSAAAFLGGHPGTQVHAAVAVAAYAAVRLALLEEAERGARLRRAGLVLAGGGLGLALAAVAWLPSSLLVPGSTGQELRSGGGSPVPLKGLGTLVLPDWWGNPSEAGAPVLTHGLFTNYNERTLYAGIVPLLLAGSALLNRAAWRSKAPIAALGALGLAIAFHVQPVHLVSSNVPPLSDVSNNRMILLVQLALAILGALGLEELLRARRVPRSLWLFAAGAVALGLAAFARALSEPPIEEIARREPALRVAIIGALFGAALFLWRRSRVAAVVAIAVLGAADGFQFAHDYQPSGPPDKVVPPTPPSVSYLKRHAGDQRFAAVSGGESFTFYPDSGMLYRLSDVSGHDPPEPGERYGRLLASAGAHRTGGQLPTLSGRARLIPDLLGVRYLYRNPQAPPLEDRGLSEVYRGPDGILYRNDRAAPRVRVPRRIAPAAGEDAAFDALFRPGFDPARDAVVEPGRGAPPAAGEGVARIVEEGNSSITVDARMARRGVVVLGDSWHDGWRVEVDGRPARQFRVDAVLRGVQVPAGRHRVEWLYRVPGLAAGLAISAAAVLTILLWAGLLWRRRRQVVQ